MVNADCQTAISQPCGRALPGDPIGDRRGRRRQKEASNRENRFIEHRGPAGLFGDQLRHRRVGPIQQKSWISELFRLNHLFPGPVSPQANARSRRRIQRVAESAARRPRDCRPPGPRRSRCGEPRMAGPGRGFGVVHRTKPLIGKPRHVHAGRGGQPAPGPARSDRSEKGRRRTRHSRARQSHSRHTASRLGQAPGSAVGRDDQHRRRSAIERHLLHRRRWEGRTGGTCREAGGALRMPSRCLGPPSCRWQTSSAQLGQRGTRPRKRTRIAQALEPASAGASGRSPPSTSARESARGTSGLIAPADSTALRFVHLIRNKLIPDWITNVCAFPRRTTVDGDDTGLPHP
jgi:hypothetical protein